MNLSVLSGNPIYLKKFISILLLSILLLVLSACQTIPETQILESEPEATFPLPTQQPESTPTFIVITVGVQTATPITTENIGVISYNDIPPGQYLMYYDEESEVQFLLSENENDEDIKISDQRGDFSQDGKKFADISNRNTLVIFDLIENKLKQIPLGLDCYSFNSWSPEGDHLALYCEGGGIFVYSLENETFKHLTNWGHPSVHSFLYPKWSPDGKWIAYAYRQLSSLSLQPGDGVYIIEVDCLDAPLSCQEKTRGPFIPRSDPSTAKIAWSPDSRYLAIHHYQQPLQVVDLDTGEILQIELDLDHIHGLAWSLDGEWITFGYRQTIYQISPRGGVPSVLAENKGRVESFLTITSTGLPSPDSFELHKPLNELLLTWQDVNQYYQFSETYSYIDMFFADVVHSIKDLSKELVDNCTFECTKQVWSTEPKTDLGLDEKEFTYFREGVIEMYRMENEEGARELADNLFNEYLPYLEEEMDADDSPNMIRHVTAPKGNTRIGMINTIDDKSGYHVLLTTSNGPISYLVLSYIPPWSDDYTTDVQLAIDFVNSQINKLQNSILIP